MGNIDIELIQSSCDFFLKFLTFTRPLAISSDVSAALLNHSFAFGSHFISEEGYSILTETSSHKKFLVSDNKFLFLITSHIYFYLSIVYITSDVSLLAFKKKSLINYCIDGHPSSLAL